MYFEGGMPDTQGNGPERDLRKLAKQLRSDPFIRRFIVKSPGERRRSFGKLRSRLRKLRWHIKALYLDWKERRHG